MISRISSDGCVAIVAQDGSEEKLLTNVVMGAAVSQGEGKSATEMLRDVGVQKALGENGIVGLVAKDGAEAELQEILERGAEDMDGELEEVLGPEPFTV